MKMNDIISQGRAFALYVIIAVAALSFAGCGGSNHRKDESSKAKPEHRDALSRVAALKLRFQQVNRTLDQLDQDVEVQKRNIAAARAEIAAIQHALGKGHLKEYSLDSITSDAVALRRLKQSREDNEILAKKAEHRDAEQAKTGVLSAVVILLFVIFLIVVGIMFWRDRDAASATPLEVNSDVSHDHSTEDLSARDETSDDNPGESGPGAP
jgi:hypothetical protein